MAGSLLSATKRETSAERERRSDKEDAQRTGELHPLAVVVELLSLANQSERFDEACGNVARAVREWLGASRVEISWQHYSRSACHWVAGAGEPNEANSGLPAIRDAAADEILMRGSLADSGAIANRDRIALLAVKRYCGATNAKRVFGVPLGAVESTVVETCDVKRRCGTLLVRYDRPVSENEAAEIARKLTLVREPLAQTLARVLVSEPTAIGNYIRILRSQLDNQRLRVVGCAFVICVAILLVPLSYRVGARCELQPVARRFVSAPIEAPLETVNVRPGDRVRKGDLLATLDAREIEMELAAKRAELERVRQEQKGQLAQHKFAESKLAALRVERLQSETDLLEHRRQRLALLAPIDGMIVSGDWKRSEGVVLERGETLFEVAPLSRFKIEVLVDESDVLSLRTGMPLTFRLDAMPGEVFQATLERIHPRAEIREDSNVFIADAMLKNTDGRLRPGMRGRGRVTTDRHPLGWNLFHKAFHRAVTLFRGF